MRVIGLISGTSHDGVDAAAVEFAGDGDVLTARVIESLTEPYPAELRARLIDALPPAPTTLRAVCALDAEIGQAFAAAAANVLERLGDEGADLICSHGQTVYHGVDDGRAWGTLQLGQPAWIAERTGLPVVSDQHNRDLAAGGQGAPLVSMLDALLFGAAPERAGVLNLGGIANFTVVGAGREPLAFDTGPGNALIDAAVLAATGVPYDDGGRLAAAGRPDAALLQRLLRDPYYRLPPPKTTGKELFNDAYLREHAAAAEGLAAEDLVATLTALTAETVAAAARDQGIERVVVSGGGSRNPTLMAWLRERLDGVPVATSDAYGLPADGKEAIAFALIGWLTAHGLPGSLPSATGAAGPRILGSITPGAGPLRLPETPARAPRALRLETAA